LRRLPENRLSGKPEEIEKQDLGRFCRGLCFAGLARGVLTYWPRAFRMDDDFLQEGTGTFTYRVSISNTFADRVSRVRELFKIALRNVTRNTRRSLITGAMVAIGVAAILFCQAYIDGLNHLIEDDVVEAANGAIQVQRKGYGASSDLAPLDINFPSTGKILDIVKAHPEVKAVAPRIQFTGLLSNGETSTMMMGLALDPEAEALVCPKGPGAKTDRHHGQTLKNRSQETVVLGQQLASGLNLKEGQTVTLLTQTLAGAMDAVDVTIAGTWDYRDPWQAKHMVVVPIETAQRLLHMQERVTAIAISLKDLSALDRVRDELEKSLAGSDPPVEVHTWGELVPYYRDVMKLQDSVLKVVIVIVFILVLAGVINTMLMSVFERTREVGTLMSIGFRRRRILTLFLLESSLLGAVSAVIGGIVGTGLVLWAGHVGLPFHVPGVGVVMNRPVFNTGFLFLSVVGTLVAAGLGGLYPAYRASRLRPVEALHAT
jgi:putative ABC transport system permease protein